MLVSLEFRPEKDVYDEHMANIKNNIDEPFQQELFDWYKKYHLEYPWCKEIKKGIYECNINFNHNIDTICSNYNVDKDIFDWPLKPFMNDSNITKMQAYIKLISKVGEAAATYGVADNYKQILRRHRKLLKFFKNKELIITMTPIIKSKQSSNGGWRWHKWGEYIGKQKPQCEYIYDEPKIDKVYCYHIYPVNRINKII